MRDAGHHDGHEAPVKAELAIAGEKISYVQKTYFRLKERVEQLALLANILTTGKALRLSFQRKQDTDHHGRAKNGEYE